jgi:Skp family chaperone for outer membrane proteins
MKKIHIVLALPAIFSMFVSFAATTDTNPGGPSVIAKPTASGPTLISDSVKIRYIDPYKIIPNLDQWQDERMKIQKDLETRTKQIEDLKTAYTTKVNQIQSMGNIVKDNVKESAIEELKSLESSIQVKQQSFQEYAERATQEAQMVIFKEIETAAKKYAQQNNIDFIFAGGAIFVNEKYDISDTLSTSMNNKYRAQKKKSEPTKSSSATPIFDQTPKK